MKKLAMAMMLGVAALSARRKNIRHTETAQQLHDGESAGSR